MRQFVVGADYATIPKFIRCINLNGFSDRFRSIPTKTGFSYKAVELFKRFKNPLENTFIKELCFGYLYFGVPHHCKYQNLMLVGCFYNVKSFGVYAIKIAFFEGTFSKYPY